MTKAACMYKTLTNSNLQVALTSVAFTHLVHLLPRYTNKLKSRMLIQNSSETNSSKDMYMRDRSRH